MRFRNALQPERTNRAYDRRNLLTIPQNRFEWSSYGPRALDQPLDRPKQYVPRIWIFCPFYQIILGFGSYINVRLCERKLARILKVKQVIVWHSI